MQVRSTCGVPHPPPSPRTPRSYAPLDPKQHCLAELHGCGRPDALALSADELLLGVVCGETLHVYVPRLIPPVPCGATVEPAASVPLGGGGPVRSFAWCPSLSRPTAYLVLSGPSGPSGSGGTLSLGELGSGGRPARVAGDVTAACWSPDGTTLAYVCGRSVLVFADGSDGSELAAVELSHGAVPPAELVAESLSWPLPTQLLVCASQLEGGGDEAPDAYLMSVSWGGGGALPTADDLVLEAFTPFMIEEVRQLHA
jgi:hypothetical protein